MNDIKPVKNRFVTRREAVLRQITDIGRSSKERNS